MSVMFSDIFDFRPIMAMVVVVFLCHCSGGNGDLWDDIDYSKVRDGATYENDDNYTPPTVLTCTSDDLYTCN